MDYVTCFIQLGGDPQQVMWRGADRPVSWPEVSLLQSLHGDESVFDCKFHHSEPTSIFAEKDRLIGIYGKEPVELVYPGRRPYIEAEFPGDRPGAPVLPPTSRADEPALRAKTDKRLPPNRPPPEHVEI